MLQSSHINPLDNFKKFDYLLVGGSLPNYGIKR